MKALLSLILFAIFTTAQAQMEFVQDFPLAPGYTASWALIDNDMPKMIVKSADHIQVYNLDFSLYTEFSVPDEYTSSFHLYITRSLFDCDTTQLEYMAVIGNVDPNESYIRVLHEDGSELFALDGYFLAGYVTDMDFTTKNIVSDSAGTYFTFTDISLNDLKI